MSYPRGPDHPTPPPGWSSGAPGADDPPGRPPAGALHPLDINRLIQLATSLIRFRWRALFGATLALLAPAYVVLALIGVASGDALTRWSVAVEQQAGGAVPSLDDLPPFPVGEVLVSWIAGIAAGVVGAIAMGALVFIVARTYAGEHATATDGIRAAVNRAGSLIGSYFLVMLAVIAIAVVGFTAGAVLLIVTATPSGGLQPGPAVLGALIVFVATIAILVFVTLRWSLVVHAIVVEGKGALDGLGRSWRIVSGSTWRMLGYFLLYGLLAFLFGLLLATLAIVLLGTAPLEAGPPQGPLGLAATALVETLAAVVLAPPWAAAFTLLYYDLRWRRGEIPGAIPGPMV